MHGSLSSHRTSPRQAIAAQRQVAVLVKVHLAHDCALFHRAQRLGMLLLITIDLGGVPPACSIPQAPS